MPGYAMPMHGNDAPARCRGGGTSPRSRQRGAGVVGGLLAVLVFGGAVVAVVRMESSRPPVAVVATTTSSRGPVEGRRRLPGRFIARPGTRTRRAVAPFPDASASAARPNTSGPQKLASKHKENQRQPAPSPTGKRRLGRPLEAFSRPHRAATEPRA
jgi:hypothetical protein